MKTKPYIAMTGVDKTEPAFAFACTSGTNKEGDDHCCAKKVMSNVGLVRDTETNINDWAGEIFCDQTCADHHPLR